MTGNTERRSDDELIKYRLGRLEENYESITKKLDVLHDDMVKRNTIVGAVIIVTTGVTSAAWAFFTQFFKH
jgi:hypothetical protein